MNQTTVEKKIFNIQSELDFLKKFFIKKPDFEIDEKNWKKISSEVKRIRRNFRGVVGKISLQERIKK